MKKQKNIFQFPIQLSILDKNLFEMITNEMDKQNIKYDFDNDYNLFINFNSSDLKEIKYDDYLNNYKRPWHSTYNSLEKMEVSLKILSNKIKECVENNYIQINNIYLTGSPSIINTQIILQKNGTYEDVKRQVKSKKIYIDVTLLENIKINKIVDSMEFIENYYIDERNNDKKLFNKLLFDKKNNDKIDIKSLTEKDWKQLILKEKVTIKDLSNLYDLKESSINKIRKEFIPSIRQYEDEYNLYYFVLYEISRMDFYSNFCIPLLENMKLKKIKAIYEYLNPDYNELFDVSEELRRQKEIEKNNLDGKEYIMPLSGVLLKKVYLAVKNNELDRKIFKNNLFNEYYAKTFFRAFLNYIEENHILDLYETGYIYQHPLFKTYQDLYKELNIEESNSMVPTLVSIQKSKPHEKKKSIKKICSPRDYIKLSKIKIDVGNYGQELAFNYEFNRLKDFPELQNKIEKTYLINEAAGYDIKSYDIDESVIYIEVKTSKTSGLNRIRFNISDTEDELISENDNAYIYYIYDLDEPKLRIIDHNNYLKYKKRVVSYEIDQEVLSD